jgi:hypothetical protein
MKATFSVGWTTNPEDQESVQVSAPAPGGSTQERQPELSTIKFFYFRSIII